MRKIRFSLLWILSLLMVVFVSCKDDDNGGNTSLVEDGLYLVGDATSFTDVDSKLLMTAATNEAASNAARDGMYEIYTALETGKTFYIAEVAGKTVTTYGPSAVSGEFFAYNPNGKMDQVRVTIQLGKYAEGVTTFTVPENGLYHVVIDKQLGKVAIIPVPYWGIIGASVPGGWSTESQMALEGSFSKTSMIYKVTDLVMRKGTFKFRHSNGWKVQLDDTSTVAGASTVKVNTNFGGTVAAPVAGATDISFAEADEGKYTVQTTWSLTSGLSFSLAKTGTIDPLPTYPDSMYVAGAGTTYGWPTVGPGENKNAAMHKVAGGTSYEGLYWKICYLNAGQGFKIAGKNWGEPNLDYSEVTTWDPNGVTVSADGSNWTVATSGMYMIVLDLRTTNEFKVSIIAPEVYGMDAPFGNPNWTTLPAAKFTVNNTDKTLVSPVVAAAGNLRSFVSHAWLGDWWHAEFIVNGTDIVYRNDGGDLAAIALSVGQVVTYHFDDNTGSITTPTK